MNKIVTKTVLALVFALSIAEKSMAIDVVILPLNIIAGEPGKAFSLTKEYAESVTSEPLSVLVTFFVAPLFFLDEKITAATVSEQQLKDFGYSDREIVDIKVDAGKINASAGKYSSKESAMEALQSMNLSEATKSLYNLK